MKKAIIVLVLVAGAVGTYYYMEYKNSIVIENTQAVEAREVIDPETKKKQDEINTYMQTEEFKRQALASAELWWEKKRTAELEAELTARTTEINAKIKASKDRALELSQQGF